MAEFVIKLQSGDYWGCGFNTTQWTEATRSSTLAEARQKLTFLRSTLTFLRSTDIPLHIEERTSGSVAYHPLVEGASIPQDTSRDVSPRDVTEVQRVLKLLLASDADSLLLWDNDYVKGFDETRLKALFGLI